MIEKKKKINKTTLVIFSIKSNDVFFFFLFSGKAKKNKIMILFIFHKTCYWKKQNEKKGN